MRASILRQVTQEKKHTCTLLSSDHVRTCTQTRALILAFCISIQVSAMLSVHANVSMNATTEPEWGKKVLLSETLFNISKGCICFSSVTCSFDQERVNGYFFFFFFFFLPLPDQALAANECSYSFICWTLSTTLEFRTSKLP